MNIYIHISIMIAGYRGQENQALNYREKKHINVFFLGGKQQQLTTLGVVFFFFSGQQTFAFKNDFVAKLRFSILYFLADNVWKSGCLL